MNSSIINQIYKDYNDSCYYNLDGYISINDDRIGRIVMFKLNEENDRIIADFKERSQIRSISNPIRTDKKIIRSLEDFKKKWNEFYNDLH